MEVVYDYFMMNLPWKKEPFIFFYSLNEIVMEVLGKTFSPLGHTTTINICMYIKFPDTFSYNNLGYIIY